MVLKGPRSGPDPPCPIRDCAQGLRCGKVVTVYCVGDPAQTFEAQPTLTLSRPCKLASLGNPASYLVLKNAQADQPRYRAWIHRAQGSPSRAY